MDAQPGILGRQLRDSLRGAQERSDEAAVEGNYGIVNVIACQPFARALSSLVDSILRAEILHFLRLRIPTSMETRILNERWEERKEEKRTPGSMRK